MKKVKLFLSSIQMIGSVCLFFVAKSDFGKTYKAFAKVTGDQVTYNQGMLLMSNILLVIFGLYFIIGLFFFINTLKEKE